MVVINSMLQVLHGIVPPSRPYKVQENELRFLSAILLQSVRNGLFLIVAGVRVTAIEIPTPTDFVEHIVVIGSRSRILSPGHPLRDPLKQPKVSQPFLVDDFKVARPMRFFEHYAVRTIFSPSSIAWSHRRSLHHQGYFPHQISAGILPQRVLHRFFVFVIFADSSYRSSLRV